jgi:hypothetical protein
LFLTLHSIPSIPEHGILSKVNILAQNEERKEFRQISPIGDDPINPLWSCSTGWYGFFS